ncbi:glycoside hydrolase family 130 protein [Planctomycetota bacterium]
MQVYRSNNNPLISPGDVEPSFEGFEVIGVFNAGVARFGDETILLLRVAERPISPDADTVLAGIYNLEKGCVELKSFSKADSDIDLSDPRLIKTPTMTYLTSISHLQVARSSDGINFTIENESAIWPENEYEDFGVEDPRITFIDGRYYITYVGVSRYGVTTHLASTADFKSYERHGVIFYPDNKDVVLFPEKINGCYWALHRPVSPLFGKGQIWICESDDLKCWGGHKHLMSPAAGKWDSVKIGAGAAPFKTKAGWVEIYHGVDTEDRYCLGAVLLERDQPWRIIARTDEPIFVPEADYETRGFFSNVVFSCGLLFEQDNLNIYYGAADKVCAYAQIRLEDILKALKV